MFCYCSEEDDDIVSSGPGIEREVMYTVYHQFEMAAEQWFMPRADNLATLATSHSIATARYVPAARLSDLSILGAIVAILLIHGIAPARLDPLVLQYFIYDCDLNSIHPILLSEWHPDLHSTITQWIQMGPNGNIDGYRGHFATYHDISVGFKYFYYLLICSNSSSLSKGRSAS